MAKLNQIVALEKGIKTRSAEKATAIYHSFKKTDLFTGHTKTYAPTNENGEKQPDNVKQVQFNAAKLLNDLSATLTELFDATFVRDTANCHAFADVVVDGQTIVPRAPVSYLLWLEKRLNDIYTEVKNIPTLDTADRWTYDANQGMYVTNPVETVSTKKVSVPFVLYAHTKEHPAQVKEVVEDQRVGIWSTVKQSTAMPVDRKETLIARVEKLQRAVKQAREEANLLDVPSTEGVGKKIFDFILAP